MLPTEISQTRVAPRRLLYQLTLSRFKAKAFSLLLLSIPMAPSRWFIYPTPSFSIHFSALLTIRSSQSGSKRFPTLLPAVIPKDGTTEKKEKKKKVYFTFILACLSDITPPGFGSLILPAALTKRSVHIKRPGILLRIGCSSPRIKAQVWSVRTMCRPRRAINIGPGMHRA